LAILGVALGSTACATTGGAPSPSAADEPSACPAVEQCSQRPRECRVELRPFCPTCGGTVPTCVPRSAAEIADLDELKARCEHTARGTYSYAEGCSCEGHPCTSDGEPCDPDPVFGCVDGILREPPRQ